MKNQPINLFKNKIKYLALGDSIAEGFNPLYGFGFPGKIKMNSNGEKKVLGISYPAYLASLINKVSPNSLDSFENFALTGTRVSDWLYFLGVEPTKYNYENSKTQILAAKDADLIENNPWKKRAYKQFGSFGKTSKSDFDYLKYQIKKANIITITIGANDLLTKIPFFEIISWTKGLLSDEELNKIITDIHNVFIKEINLLFKALRKLNPTANIIATNYPTTMSKFIYLIGKKVTSSTKYPKGLIFHNINLLNEEIAQASQNHNINYVNLENREYWKRNIDDLSSVFFEIHPTTFGYKKMAYELFAKISLSNAFYNQTLEEIQKIFTNTNDEFIKLDYKNFSNVLDFSTINVSDNQIIKLTKIADEKFFWLDNSQEEPYLKLQRNPTPKNYIFNNYEGISSNSRSLLNSLILFISINNPILDIIIKKYINQNQKYLLFLIESFVNSKYLDIVTMQIQAEFYKNKQVDSILANQIILNKLLNFPNIVLLLNDLGVNFIKLNNVKFIKLTHKTIESLFLNFIKSKKYRVFVKEYIKKYIIDNFALANKDIKLNLLEEYINNFIDSEKFKNFVINLMNSFFVCIEENENFKNVDVFIKKYNEEFFKNINLNLALENISKNDILQDVIIELTSSFLEMKKLSEQDQLVFKKFIKLLMSKVKNKDLVEDISTKIFQYFNSIENSFQLTSFFQSIKNHEFWNLLKKISVKKLWTNKDDVFVLADMINLIFEKSNINGRFYTTLMNLEHSNRNKNKKEKNLSFALFNVWKDLLLKMKKIEKNYLLITDTLYNSYLEFKKANPTVTNENNPYYKAYYRFVVSSLWISYRLFQKDNLINIFWNTKKGILQSLPSISNQIHRLAMGNTLDYERKELVDYIFNDLSLSNTRPYNLNIISDNDSLDDDDLEQSMLWYIKNSDTDNINDSKTKNNVKSKKDIIFDSLIKGYWKK